MSNEFFVVRESYTDFAQAYEDERNQTITRRCRVCGAVFSDRKYDRFRVRFVGKKEGDFYFAPICIIVSEKFLRALYDNNITGFSTQEITCTGWYDRRGKWLDIDTSKYKELMVNGRAGSTQMSYMRSIACGS